MSKDIKKTKDAEPVKKALGKDNLLVKTKNIRVKNTNNSVVNEVLEKIVNNDELQNAEIKTACEKLVAQCYKAAISSQHPELFKYFKDMNYEQLNNCINKNHIKGEKDDTLDFTIPAYLIQSQGAPLDGQIYTTTFSISPNSFWSNITNILNEVSVGDNFINTGDSFNAWNFYRTSTLQSGEAALRTIGQTLSGVCLLNQNYLVPPNTQMLKGYQASLGVFINTDNPQDVGGGTGMGLFVMYSTPINVLKLAVTNPQQFGDMLRIFQATAINTREYSLWVIATYNLLSNISNIIVDNYNTNIRNCLNGTLFPAIQIMKNPTNEFNCGLIGTCALGLTGTGTNATFTTISPLLNYENIISGYFTNSNGNNVNIDNIEYTLRSYSLQTLSLTNPDGTTNPDITQGWSFTSPYNVPGSSSYPRIQISRPNEIHLIVSPEFFVGLKSGTLSQLFHWEYQRLEEYVPPENIHMLYKQVDIPSGYLMNGSVANENGNTGYAWNVNSTLGNRWFPKNVIYLVTKPTDVNQWTANYGLVWTNDMSNDWGAGMIKTSYLHYALYGGVLPWSNGCCFYFKNLMNLVSDNSQAIMTNFALGEPVNQNQTVDSESGSGGD